MERTREEPLPSIKPLDCHVHIVGTGSGGTGCWLRLRGWRRPLARMLLYHIGLPASALKEDFDRLYVERLLALVRSSSLGAAVILAQEQVYGEDGKTLENQGAFYVPNDYVLELARQHLEFIPAVSIHPARPDALEELERCLNAGAAMLKLLPNCQNIDCNAARYRRFWERMAEAGLPLLAHTGGEHTLPVVRPDLAAPQTLTLPLECGVTVIAAHCGTSSGLFDRDYFAQFAEMASRYPRLFGDNSAFNVPIRGRHVPECLQSPLAKRIVHGSDLPVPVHGHFAWLNRTVGWAAFRKWEKHSNVLERDYQLKRAMGFTPETFTRIRKLLRPGLNV
jgi:hypothetical protein